MGIGAPITGTCMREVTVGGSNIETLAIAIASCRARILAGALKYDMDLPR